MQLTRAVTNIPLKNANASKLAALDTLAEAYMALCQTYVTHFCTVAKPDRYADFVYPTPLSARWQRVAIQQAAGVAQSWRTRRAQACAEYLTYCRYYADQDEARRAQLTPPTWREWRVPELKQTSIQATANVVMRADEPPLQVEVSRSPHCDFWLRVSTLDKRQPLWLPVQLAAYHREVLQGQVINSSTTLARRADGSWWLTLSLEETVKACEDVSGYTAVDMGIVNALTDEQGRRYGLFDEKLKRRHQAERAKRQRKAKLRACLAKKGVSKLPSTADSKLSRHVRQRINRAINQFFEDHPNQAIVCEDLSVAGMRFRAKELNAYLSASNLAHISEQLAWGAAKRGVPFIEVNPAYSSQECHHCHWVARANRPDQQTFCCQVCGTRLHADVNAARNLLSRAGDEAVARCQNLAQVKSLLLARHVRWKQQHGCP